MLDIKRIRQNPEALTEAMRKRRGKGADVSGLIELDAKRRELMQEAEQLKARRNEESAKVPAMKKAGQNTTELMAEMKKVGGDGRDRYIAKGLLEPERCFSREQHEAEWYHDTFIVPAFAGTIFVYFPIFYVNGGTENEKDDRNGFGNAAVSEHGGLRRQRNRFRLSGRYLPADGS